MTRTSLRIGITAEFLGTQAPGPQTLIRTQLEALSTQPPHHDYYPYVALSAELGRLRESLPANFHPQLVWPYSGWVRVPVSLPLRLMVSPVDVLHAQNVAPPLARCAVVVTINDLAFEKLPETYPLGLRTRLRRAIRWSAQRADIITIPSRTSMADLVSIYGLPESKLVHLQPSCPVRLTPCGHAEGRARVAERFGVKGPFLLSVSAIEPKKNLDRLVTAFDRLAQEFQELQLIICGPRKWMSGPVVQAIDRASFRHRITITGFVPEEDLPYLYSGAEAYVTLSAYEGFGFTPVEAMACMTPVVVSDRGSLPETVGGAALVVDPDDLDAVVAAVRSVLTTPSLAESLRQSGRQRVAELSPERWGRRLVEVYEHAASLRSGNSAREARPA